MTRETLAALIEGCRVNLGRYGGHLDESLPARASDEEIERLDTVMWPGRLPASYRAFLRVANGLLLTAYVPTRPEAADWLEIFSIETVVWRTLALQNRLIECNSFRSRRKEYLQFGVSRDSVLALSLHKADPERNYEAPVSSFYADEPNFDELLESNTNADGFEQWLMRSLESMGSTDCGFDYAASVTILSDGS